MIKELAILGVMMSPYLRELKDFTGLIGRY